MRMNSNSIRFFLFCMLEFLSVDGFGFSRSRGFLSESSFLPTSHRALRTRTFTRSTFGSGGSSTGSLPWIQQTFNGGRSAGSSPGSLARRGHFSLQDHDNRRRALLLHQDDRRAVLWNTHHRRSGTTSRERFGHSIQSSQPNNFIRERSVLLRESRPSSNIASILQRIRTQQNGKSSKEATMVPEQPLNQGTRHRTISFLQNRRPHSNSKEVRSSSLGSITLQNAVRHPVIPFLDRRRPPPQTVNVPDGLKKQHSDKTSKEVKDKVSTDKEAKLRKLRQLLMFIPQTQRYDFLLGLKAVAASKSSAEKRNLKNTKPKYPQELTRKTISLTPMVSITSDAVPYQPAINTIQVISKKKTSEEKKGSLILKNTDTPTDGEVQRILLLQKLNSFLRKQLNNNKGTSSKNTNVLLKDKNKSKEVTFTSNTHVGSPKKIQPQQDPERYLGQSQYEMSRLALEPVRLNPHRHRLHLHAKLDRNGHDPSTDFVQVIKRPVHSNGNAHLVHTNQPDLQNISPFSRLSHSLVLVDQNDLNISKEKISAEKLSWVNP